MPCEHRVTRNKREECDLTRDTICPEPYIPDYDFRLCKIFDWESRKGTKNKTKINPEERKKKLEKFFNVKIEDQPAEGDSNE